MSDNKRSTNDEFDIELDKRLKAQQAERQPFSAYRRRITSFREVDPEDSGRVQEAA